MSISLPSDEETIDQSHISNIQVLIKENNIKDLALSKATSLIELLNVELEVQRNNKEEALRQVEEQLRHQFSKQLEGMKQKIEFLERQLKRRNAIDISNNTRTKMHSSLSRSESSYSLQGKKRRTINKKSTQLNSQESNTTDKQNKMSIQFLKDHLVNIEQWKETVIDDLNILTNNEFSQLQELLVRLESKYAELQDTFSEPLDPQMVHMLDSLISENSFLKQIVNEQQTIINELKMQMQDFQDVYKHAIFKMANQLKSNTGQKVKNFDINDIILHIKIKLSQEKKEWTRKIQILKDQNIELKSILDSMINLVQNDRRIRI